MESGAKKMNLYSQCSCGKLNKVELRGLVVKPALKSAATKPARKVKKLVPGQDIVMVLINPAKGSKLKPFCLGTYQVTQGQWEAVMGNNPSHFIGDHLPVETVSWDDCQKFIKKLNAATGLNYRLPTEAEWEYACGPDSEQKPLGDYAWYWGNSDGETHPVGNKKPNCYGLNDMLGNVWEWCQDLYTEDGSYRVFRGGSWDGTAYGCRSAFRSYDGPSSRARDLGLRLARS